MAKKLTTERSLADFQKAYRAKSKLVKRQKEDFLFRLGSQWDEDKFKKLKEAGVDPVTDNRIQSNIFLLTGLERQNRSDFKAFPQGEEDSIKAEIASALFKDSIKVSDFGYKKSEAFEDGATCGESHLELYLDNTYNLLNGKPCWKKLDSSGVFPEPGFKEYDYSDARYVYKLTLDLSQEDLIALFPDKKKKIEDAEEGKLSLEGFGSEEKHVQPKDYKKTGGERGSNEKDAGFDLIERYYKKWVETYYVGDRQTGEIQEAEGKEKAEGFVGEYKSGIAAEQEQFVVAQQQFEMAQMSPMPVDPMNSDPMAVNPMPMQPPTPPQQRDSERFFVFTRLVPEIWYFAHVPSIDTPLADEKAWFYPKWKHWPIIPYFAHFSTAPIDGDDRHLLVQGIVHGVKGAQKKHNSAETLMLLHLNGAANSGWLVEDDAWLDPKMVQKFGATPNVNLTYKKGAVKPERIFPMALSQGHFQLSESSAEAIKAQLGINADLLAVQEGGQSSGRAIALRQRQGLLMIQKLFDNLSRTSQLCGRFLLTQLGEIYDTETAKKVLGEAFLQKNFPPPMVFEEGPDGQPAMNVDPMTGMASPKQVPMQDPKTGQPMSFDAEMAEVAIAEVLAGDLGQYDVSVGEAVASETTRMAQFAEMKELAGLIPMAFSPAMIVENSDLPNHMKSQALKNIQSAPPMLPAPSKGKQPAEAV